jgi:Xaa-Pro aminopeptidase
MPTTQDQSRQPREAVIANRYFPVKEYEDRWARAHALMEQRGIEAAVVWGRAGGTYDRCADPLYLTNHYSSASGQELDNPLNNARAFSAVILKPGEVPELHVDEPDPRMDLIATDRVAWHSDPIAGVAAALNRRGITGPVALVGTDLLPMKYWRELEAATPDIDWQPTDDLIQAVRRVKSPREHDCLREGGEIASRALNRLMEGLVGGRTEAEAVADAVSELIRSGATCQLIPVASGESISRWCTDPFTGCSTVAPKPGDMVRGWLDSIIFQGYWLDPGRTAVAGGKPNRAQTELMENCAHIVGQVIEQIRPGAKVVDVARFGDRLSAELGGAGSQMNQQWPLYGHGIGMYWEHPYIGVETCDHNDRFEAGMALGVEVFLAAEGVGLAAFEQNLLLHDDGTEIITHSPLFWW